MELFRRIAARYRRMDPFKADVALTALFIAGMLVEAALVDPQGHSRTVTAVAGSLALLPLAWRRRSPLFAAVGFGLLAIPQDWIGSFFFFGNTTSPFVASLLLAYSVGRHLDGGRPLWGVAVLLGGLAIGLAGASGFAVPGDVVWLAILFAPPFLAGRAIRGRVLLRRELRAKAERLEAEREHAALRAVEDERARIATELQTVVANGVSAMVVQAEAVPRVLAAGDTARAREALEVIEVTGRDALAEMRRLLGVLRREGERAALAPQPGLGRLEALLERVRAAGLDVELTVEGERRALAAGVDLTAYRVVQEALDAAVAATAGRAAITLRYGSRDLELEVRDDRTDAHAEDRVAALRERVNLYGGHVRGSSSEDGGYTLEARLPAATPAEAAAVAGGRS